jgi:aryl-phospho-beta-D-glucosidase BglC (GH1 family)
MLLSLPWSLRSRVRAARPPIVSAIFLILLTTACSAPTAQPTPVGQHGHLSVRGNRIVDQQQQPVSLAGPSLFWGNKGWKGDQFFHPKTVTYAKNEWHASIIRIAMGVEISGGLLHDWAGRQAKIKTVIDAALAEGLYVIIDWHSHHAEDYVEEAKTFFRDMAMAYGQYPNVIYEIYNEPLPDADWSSVIKPYAEAVIAVIREVDPDNLIVVGTQSWAQDVDKAADDPLTGFTNIVYALHFYAGTHKQELRDKAKYALDKGLALMVTEWGSMNSDGDGAVDHEETQRWMAFLRTHNLSHCNWSFNNKDESASVFKPGTNPAGPWTDKDLTESGLLAKRIIKNW